MLVHFHGGRFVSGAKNRESLPLLYRLASRGWLCISANYRLSPQAGFPDYVIDAKRVLAWVRSHGVEYGADPSTVFVAGNSAGGYYGQTDADRAESGPSTHINQDAPPFLLVHGDRDNVVPVSWARDFARALRQVSDQPVVYTELPGGQHSFDYFDSLRGRIVVDQIESFTAWVRSRGRRPDPAGGSDLTGPRR